MTTVASQSVPGDKETQRDTSIDSSHHYPNIQSPEFTYPYTDSSNCSSTIMNTGGSLEESYFKTLFNLCYLL